jgi:hypothetical protein
MNIQWKNYHSNFKTHNDVVLDPIVEINLVSVEKHPKVYDLTIPTTLNSTYIFSNPAILRCPIIYANPTTLNSTQLSTNCYTF